MGIMKEDLLVNGSNTLVQQALFAVNDKSSLMEDIEFRGGGDGDYEDAKEFIPTLQYKLTNELKNGSPVNTKDKTEVKQTMDPSDQRSTTSSFMVLALVFGVSVLSLSIVYLSFP